jgi:serine/threonine protein kinase|mmetsp:Transcript_10249/g.16723  ORF Transcript_10249/g.16723 Transcript_10249/m.16723 type:complete len:776 (-) Transcript_10249:185-2512(-)
MGCGGSAPQDSNSGGGGSTGATKNSKAGGNNAQKKLLDFYNVGEMLGQGAFGIVYACKKIDDPSKDLAVKMVDKAETPLDKIREEFGMLQRMEHNNVIKCQDVIVEKCFVCIVMDRLRGGDLIVGMQAHWKSKGKIPVLSTVSVTAQMAESIAYLHANSVIHRDIKGDNYLCDRPDIVDPKIRIVLTDFGTAADCEETKRLKEKCGTKLYWSPEFYKLDYTLKVDVWAMGVIVYGLINGKFPFRDEKDINNKDVTVPKGTPKECEDFVKKVLTKKEDARPKAKEVLQHNWISGKVSHSDIKDEGGADFKPEIEKDDHAAAGVGERRNEMVERMQEGKDKKNQPKQKGEEHYWKEWFSIVDRHAKNSTLKYEWWSQKKIDENQVLSLEGAKSVNVSEANNETANVSQVNQQLTSHGIDTSKFGQGTAKPLTQLAHEVQTGACTLLLDASEFKKLVRVVDVVLLRISAPGNKQRIFVETGEIYQDNRERMITRLPGTKKEPHMNSKQVADKIIAETMDLGEATVKFDFNTKEVFEEKENSPSYPGVMTVYRKEIISGELVVLNAKGKKPEDVVTLKHKDKAGLTKIYAWMSTADADKKGVAYKAPEEGDEVSGLVQAPIGMQEEELQEYLIKNKVDISKFGIGQAKTLKDISAELMKGESQLMLEQNGNLIRVVDVVVIKLVHSVSASILVQTEQTLPTGEKTVLKRLPGAKRRPDENQFLTARRILKRQLKIEENHVTLDAQNVQVAEEIKDSMAYPGLRTTYRKRIITATLAKDS